MVENENQKFHREKN